LRPGSLRFNNGVHQWIGAVMTVGNNANLHTIFLLREPAH
jgi:hypothetical protein